MRPYIICHMIASIDGRIDCDMTEQIEQGDEYYDALNSLGCPSVLMGRVTMQMHYALPQPFVADDAAPIGREAFHIANKTNAYCIAIDTSGRLRWDAAEYDSQALLVITDCRCPRAYHNTLTAQGISWIAVGNEGIDLPRAMQILSCEFGVERLAVTGGGHINAAFLNANLLDEVSLMIAPGIDGRAGMTAVFDGLATHTQPTQLHLTSVQQMGETVWMRYKL